MSAAAAQTAAANEARRRRTEEKLRHVADAIGQLRRRRLPVTYPAIASRAGVSRTFLYDNPAAREMVTAAITRADGQRRHEAVGRDAQADASWQQRAVNAEEALKAAHAEIRTQRARIGELLGQLRDAQHEHDSDAVQRITSENNTFKQRVRQLTAENRTLEERLQAARSNNRFADRRIAQLEAQLLEHPAGRAERGNGTDSKHDQHPLNRREDGALALTRTTAGMAVTRRMPAPQAIAVA